MVMVLKLSNVPDELSKNDELREFELSGCDGNKFQVQVGQIVDVRFFFGNSRVFL